VGNIERVYEVVHHVDIQQDTVEDEIIIQGDLNEYNELLIKSMLDATNKKYFNFKSSSTEVHTLIKEIISGEAGEKVRESNTKNIAKRLHREEQGAQQKIKHLTNLQKGSLVQSLIKYEDTFYYLLTKIEHERFLNTTDLVNQIGLPYDKRTLKSCLISIDDEKEINEIIVTDSNNKISSYWYDAFLELVELNSDELNTKTAFSAVDAVLTRNVKSKSSADHTLLRNNLIGYFRTNDTYNHDNMIQNVFGDYLPENKDLIDMVSIKEKVRKIGRREGFDSVFLIKDDAIRARMRSTIKISDKIELKLMGHIEQLKNDIHSRKKPNGDKFLYIKIDDEKVYKMFKY